MLVAIESDFQLNLTKKYSTNRGVIFSKVKNLV